MSPRRPLGRRSSQRNRLMANYVLPTFNLPFSIWRAASPPPAAPALSSIGNLSPGRIVGIPLASGGGTGLIPSAMWLRMPAGVDIRDSKWGGTPDIVEVPTGSGRFYDVVWVDDIGGGFANEHRFAQLAGKAPWPTPFPPPIPTPPPPPTPILISPVRMNTLGIPAQQWGIGSAAKVNATERSDCFVCFGHWTGGVPVCKVNGVPTAPVVAFAVSNWLGANFSCGWLQGTMGVGVDNYQVDAGVGFTSEGGMMIINTQNALLNLMNPALTWAVGTPPFACPFAGVGVTNAVNTCLAGGVEGTFGAGQTPFLAPFADFGGPMALTIWGGPFIMNYAGKVNAAVGALNASETAVATGHPWQVAVLGMK